MMRACHSSGIEFLYSFVVNRFPPGVALRVLTRSRLALRLSNRHWNSLAIGCPPTSEALQRYGRLGILRRNFVMNIVEHGMRMNRPL
jgi:hypothetical protein